MFDRDFLKNSPANLILLQINPFIDSFLFVMFHVCLCYAVFSVPCSLAFACWERTDLLPLLCIVFLSLYHLCLDPHQNLVWDWYHKACLSLPVFFTDRSKGVLFYGSFFLYLCVMFLFVMLSCLFLAALWSPAVNGLTSWLSCVWCVILAFFDQWEYWNELWK